MFDSELDSFKRNIDMRVYAASLGFVLDKKESWRGSAVMRHPDGDKIIIKREPDGHYVFFSVRDDRVNGSIIDFVQKRKGLTLGAVRKELRPWIGLSAVTPSSSPALPVTRKDRFQVEIAFSKMEDARHHPYLEMERGIPGELLRLDRFAGRVKRDVRGNAVFPHLDRDGLCGYEIKNKSYTGFASGGTKGLWLSHEHADDNRLVFCESAIDALSYAALFPDDHTRYASIGGKPSPAQLELIRATIARMPAGSEIVAAMDADKTGRELAESVKRAGELSGRVDLLFRLEEPEGGKDWNEILTAKSKSLSSCRPESPQVL